tara:strand:+ start:56397 stop:57248 length:852 start_codon:yes stop_codon:yes gene_type:complete
MKKQETFQSIKSILTLAVCGTMISCSSKNDSGTTQVTSSFKMTGSASTASVASSQKPTLWNVLIKTAHALVPTSIVDAQGSAITLSSAWTVIKEIEFKSEETAGGSEDSQSEVSFKGPYFVNLLSSAPQALDTQSITKKSIKRIKMKLEATQAQLPTDAPAGLASNSIYMAGSVGGRNFTFQLDDGTEYQIGGSSAFQPSENSQIMVEIQIANIFKQIDLSSVTNNEVIDHNNRHTGSNLCTSIDTSANDLYTCIRKGLEKHANLGLDKNGDSSLDADEDKVK